MRFAFAAAQTGTGETQMAQLCGAMNMPAVRGPTWSKAAACVTKGTLAAAEDSRKRARAEERQLAFAGGGRPDGDGDMSCEVEEDMCWAKRSSGKCYNSKEGSTTVVWVAAQAR